MKHKSRTIAKGSMSVSRVQTQLHCIPREVMAEGSVFDTLRELKRQGKIENCGASVETVEEGLASLQVIFNIYREKPISELFAKAKEKRAFAVLSG